MFSEYKATFILYKRLTVGFYNKGAVFTARYGLSPYITQIVFVFKGITEGLFMDTEHNQIKCQILYAVAGGVGDTTPSQHT